LDEEMEKTTQKNIIKLCVFILIGNLPFLTLTNLLGVEIFLDSFDNPDDYQYIKPENVGLQTMTGKYIVVQKSSHPDFSLLTGESIFYIKDEGGLLCQRIYRISDQGSLKKYYTLSFDGDTEPIVEQEIIGKIIGTIDDNLWNALALEFWDISIKNLNAAALFTQ
jgi:hypothetical protein